MNVDNLRLVRAENMSRSEKDFDFDLLLEGDKHGVQLKVAGFPYGERMWVRLVCGDANGGVGILNNHPVESNLERGMLVSYRGGSVDTLPVFDEVFLFDGEQFIGHSVVCEDE
jgi:uncharacterized protein YegJ (DUF2314 family)